MFLLFIYDDGWCFLHSSQALTAAHNIQHHCHVLFNNYNNNFKILILTFFTFNPWELYTQGYKEKYNNSNILPQKCSQTTTSQSSELTAHGGKRAQMQAVKEPVSLMRDKSFPFFQILSSIALFLSYRTDSMDSRTI